MYLVMSDMFDIFRKRACFLQSIRDFFSWKKYLEVETPILSPFLLPEPSIEVFKTEYRESEGEKVPCYLIPSPELWMKRLITMGSGNIYQITKCFRNGESLEPIHNPEFTMCEWYTVNATYMDSMDMIQELLTFLYENLPFRTVFKIEADFLRLSMKEAFTRYGEIDLDAFIQTDMSGKRRIAERHGIACAPDDTEEHLFNKLFLTLIEPELPDHKPVILYDYPLFIPVCAIRKKNSHYCERWELYMEGKEIANCYSEETDPDRIQSFIERETERKNQCYVIHTIDRDLVNNFRKKIPPFTGVALGLDRLFMVLLNSENIGDVMFFPFSRIAGKKYMEKEEEYD
jgi:lysyl-tRNA synthetase class 2